MLIVWISLAFFVVVWIFLQITLVKTLKRCRTDPECFHLFSRLNGYSTLVGVLIALFGLALPIVGMIETFTNLDQIASELRAEAVVVGMDRATSWGGPVAFLSLPIGVASFVLHKRRQRKLNDIMSADDAPKSSDNT